MKRKMFINGDFITLEEGKVEAILIEEGKIKKIGTKRDIEQEIIQENNNDLKVVKREKERAGKEIRNIEGKLNKDEIEIIDLERKDNDACFY